MTKNIIRSLFVITAVTLFASCEKEAEITKMKVVAFPQSSLFTTSSTDVTLTTANDSSTVATFSWPSVDYGTKAPVTYSLQIDLPSDTSGVSAWSNAYEYVVGDGITTKAMLGTDLNAIAYSKLGLLPGTMTKVVVRVKSFVDRAAYSNAIALNVNPHPSFAYPALLVPGDYEGWNTALASALVSVNSDNKYEGYLYIPAGGTYTFKLTNAKDWNVNYGDGGSGTISTTGGNMTVASAGYYKVNANLSTKTWSATKTAWAIIGDATTGGWTTETPMTYDAANKVWTVTADLVSTGSFKFRANNGWSINMGVDSNGKMQYDGSNLTVPSSGNYTVTLDLHNPGAYAYTLKKN